LVVNYKEASVPIYLLVCLQEAIEANSYFLDKPLEYKYGDTEKAFTEAENILEGQLKIGSQEHFYLETNTAIAVPKGEDDEMDLFCSAQHPAETQVTIYYDVKKKKICIT
jgi:xanthine dehydrogenase/oxidase